MKSIRRLNCWGIMVCCTLAQLSSTTPAHASEAEQIFKNALQLTKSYRFFEACKLMERSYQLEPNFKTKYWLARCKVTLGHLASAARIYRELARELKAKASESTSPPKQAADNQKRIETVERELKAVTPDVAQLRLDIEHTTAELPNVEVRHNGMLLTRAAQKNPISIDPGTHTIKVTAPGHEAWSSVRQVGEQKDTLVAVPALQKRKPPLGRALGWIGGGVGLAAVTAGAVVAVVAKVEYDNSLSGCDGQGCNTLSRDEQTAARTKGDVATGLLLGGAALASGGAALLLLTSPSQANTLPDQEQAVQLEVGIRTAAVVLRGTW